MYCSKCGAENNDNSKYCLQCGEALIKYDNNNIQSENTSQNAALSDEGYAFLSRVYRKNKRWAWIIIISLIVIIGIYCIYNAENNKKTVETLQTFTVMEKGNGEYSTYYSFTSSNGWTLKYTDANEFVEFEEPRVYSCLSNWFQEDYIGNTGVFGYDLSENVVRIYLDYYTEEGQLSIINYDMDSKEFILRVGTKDWTVTDEFEDYMFDSGLVRAFEQNIQNFKNDLKANELSIDDVKSLKYKDIKEK